MRAGASATGLAWGSLRLRLLAGTLVWIVASIVIAGWGLNSLFSRQVTMQFDADLNNHLDQLIAQLAIGADDELNMRGSLSEPRFSTPFAGLYWQVDAAMRPGAAALPGVLRSRSLWDSVLSVPVDPLGDGQVRVHRVEGPNGNSLRALERQIELAERPGQPLRMIVAADERLLLAPIASFTRLLIIALGVLGLGLVAAAVVQVLIGLRPLGLLRETLARVREGRAERVEGHFPSEVQPLVDDFNTVLALNAEVAERARLQAGNLAHAVKTPLAILANAAARERTPFARLVEEQVAGARNQVDHHLAKARAAAAVKASGMRCAVRPTVEGLMRVMSRLHAERGLRIEWTGTDADAVFRGEEQDLEEMVGNLLDNACKWASSRVAVRLVGDATMLAVVVDDDGKGLPDAVRAAVFARGVRADEQVQGSGLGLSIVHDLAQLYGGAVALETSAMGGVRAVLSLPRAA